MVNRLRIQLGWPIVCFLYQAHAHMTELRVERSKRIVHPGFSELVRRTLNEVSFWLQVLVRNQLQILFAHVYQVVVRFEQGWVDFQLINIHLNHVRVHRHHIFSKLV